MIHKFVKTTPNPRATKKSNGELVGPLVELPWFVWEGAGDVDPVGEDMMASRCPCIRSRDELRERNKYQRASQDFLQICVGRRLVCIMDRRKRKEKCLSASARKCRVRIDGICSERLLQEQNEGGRSKWRMFFAPAQSEWIPVVVDRGGW